MTTSTLCLLCALAAVPPDSVGSIYVPTSPDRVLVRGQSPPSTVQIYSTSPTGSLPLGGTSPWAMAVSAPNTQLAQGGGGYYSDPFLDPNGIQPYGGSPTGPYGTPPIYNQFGGQVGISGINGPQPYRYGWQPRVDTGFLPGEDISTGPGEFEIFELDAEFRYRAPAAGGSVYSYAPQFGFRSWDTPVLVGGDALPSSVFTVGSDMEWSTSAAGPWSVTLGFTPSLNSDFERSPTSDAFNYDARAMLFYRASAQWMYVFGIGYLDRVNDRLLPYSGVVWTPDDRTELRLMFPQSRLSYYIGNYFSDDKWLYVSAGFHVEAYEVEMQNAGGNRREKIELSDWRAVIGLRSENDYLSTFIEGGIVFDRQVNFLKETPGFDINDGFIVRGGFRF